MTDPPEPSLRIACFATQGTDSGDERRITRLLAPLGPTVIPFDRSRRIRGVAELLRRIRAADPDVVVMEGTGVTGGLVLVWGRLREGRSYIVSSGDAVAPFLAAIHPALGLAGAVYERALCRLSSGFIGWSPYLVGRALTFGSPRAMTAPHWADLPAQREGDSVRRRLGIPSQAIVFGLVGSLNWTPRYGYCYGLELVRAVLRARREDVCVLVVGEGSGRAHLEQLAGDALGRSVFLPGAVAPTQVGDVLDAIDIASLPQSVDGVGSFRYTTKISEYLAAGLPVVTGDIPLAYDLDDGWIWRLPGEAPWDHRYESALATLMQTVSRGDIERRRPKHAHDHLFDAGRQSRQVCGFVHDVVLRERTLAH